MTTIALTGPAFATPAQTAGRTATALSSLMQSWEQETVSEDDESEAELMIMLSGMVGAHATALDGE